MCAGSATDPAFAVVGFLGVDGFTVAVRGSHTLQDAVPIALAIRSAAMDVVDDALAVMAGLIAISRELTCQTPTVVTRGSAG